MRFDLPVSEPEELSRDELIVVVRRQAGQITTMAGQLAELMEANEALAAKLARLEHLLSRNSGNSSMPPSKDDDPGKPAPPEPKRRGGGAKRSRGKQPGAPGSHLAWTDTPDELQERFPRGSCGCGADLGGARAHARAHPCREPPGTENAISRTIAWLGSSQCFTRIEPDASALTSCRARWDDALNTHSVSG